MSITIQNIKGILRFLRSELSQYWKQDAAAMCVKICAKQVSPLYTDIAQAKKLTFSAISDISGRLDGLDSKIKSLEEDLYGQKILSKVTIMEDMEAVSGDAPLTKIKEEENPEKES